MGFAGLHQYLIEYLLHPVALIEQIFPKYCKPLQKPRITIDMVAQGRQGTRGLLWLQMASRTVVMGAFAMLGHSQGVCSSEGRLSSARCCCLVVLIQATRHDTLIVGVVVSQTHKRIAIFIL